jgi:sporadic carbohydrate cluster protein (TIGR04323 family)
MVKMMVQMAEPPTERRGYRGYISSRSVRGTTTPQRVQNLVIRDYAQRRGYLYLMSFAEYAMPGSYMMLENVLTELPKLEGIILFSAFMLPPQRERRLAAYRRVFEQGATLHTALENYALDGQAAVDPFEDMIESALLLDRVPLAGRYTKTERALFESDEPFVRGLARHLSPEA